MTQISSTRRRAESAFSQIMYDQRKTIYSRVLREVLSEPQVVRVTYSLAAFLREKEILLDEDDLFAGHGQSL